MPTELFPLSVSGDLLLFPSVSVLVFLRSSLPLRTKTARTLRRIVAALCAATVLLGVLVFSTSAQEPTERVSTEGFIPNEVAASKYITFTGGRADISAYIDPSTALSVGDYIVHYNYVYCKFTINEFGGQSYYYVTPPIPIKSIIDTSDLLIEKGVDFLYYPIYVEGTTDFIDYLCINLITWEWNTYLEEVVGDRPSTWEYLVYETGGNVDEAYQSGYNQGYYEGEEDGYSQGYTNGVNTGYQNGLTDGYDNGYSDGYDTASSEIENQNALGLFGRGILDGLLDVYFDMFRIPIFGTSLGEIIGYFIFFLWVLLIVKIVAFVI